jgi:indolepyruvate ferredoxin oxidoreductase
MIVEVGDAGASPTAAGEPAAEVPDPIADTTVDLVRIRLSGIGGTGVVTVAQILSTAAMLDGWELRGLDQTGLSQKAGPVVSDVVLTRGDRTSSNLVGHGQADLLLGFDGLVAASDNAIAASDPDQTVAIVSHHRTPTGRMISEPATPYPTESIEQRLRDATRADQIQFLDATALATTLTGSAAQANLLLLGVAVQKGHIPVSVEAIENAIELNGVAVEANLAALDWGRRWAHDPAFVEAHAAAKHELPATQMVTVEPVPAAIAGRINAIVGVFDTAGPALNDTLMMLAGDLIGYQNLAYATRFLDDVESAAAAERQAGSSTGEYTETVARSMHKLMAYKDEYEVARLLLMPEGARAATEVGGPDARVAWKLHPPMLKALGMTSKVAVSSKMRAVFVALRSGKKLRGTRLDPFGRSEMRRAEAGLPDEFRRALQVVEGSLQPDLLDAAIAIAVLPDLIRGYEDLKTRRIAEYRSQTAAALDGFGT